MKIFVAKMKCKYCDTKCHKKGKRNRRQQYQCPVCYSYQKQNYVRNSLKSYDTELLIKLNNEGLGIRSIGRVLNIPKSTVFILIPNAAPGHLRSLKASSMLKASKFHQK